jgi:hypothetical protein
MIPLSHFSIPGGKGRIPPLSKNDLHTIQRKFFEPLFLPKWVGQIVPLSKSPIRPSWSNHVG